MSVRCSPILPNPILRLRIRLGLGLGLELVLVFGPEIRRNVICAVLFTADLGHTRRRSLLADLQNYRPRQKP